MSLEPIHSPRHCEVGVRCRRVGDVTSDPIEEFAVRTRTAGRFYGEPRRVELGNDGGGSQEISAAVSVNAGSKQRINAAAQVEVVTENRPMSAACE